MLKEILSFENLRYNFYVFVVATIAFVSFNSYLLWPDIKSYGTKTYIQIVKLKNVFSLDESEPPTPEDDLVEPVQPKKPVQVVKQEKAAPASQKTVAGKTWCEGNNLEWRVPEGVNSIKIKYKESNGRLILDYDFPVKPRERIEIKAE